MNTIVLMLMESDSPDIFFSFVVALVNEILSYSTIVKVFSYLAM